MAEQYASMLEEAWALGLAKKREPALRKAIALVDDDPFQLAAVALLARTLVEEGRTLASVDAIEKLVACYVRRGDLGAAVHASILADRAGGEGDSLRQTIAKAFGKGSPRIADVSPLPPPLPAAPRVPADLESASFETLCDRAERALVKFAGAIDTVKDGKLPKLPLFSELAPSALGRLLTAFELRELVKDEMAIEQGEEGREAFVVVRGTLRAERSNREDDATVLAVLGPGAIFGEMALVSEAPRAASVIAQEPTQLLVATREELENIAKDEPAIGKELGAYCRSRMISNLLRTSALLRAVPAADRDELVSRFKARSFSEGEMLVEEGQDSGGLFLIASGAVRVTKDDPDGDQLVLAELGPGEVVGEVGVVLRKPALATVVATFPTVALELSRDAFTQLVREQPSLLAELYQLATMREDETRTVVGQAAFSVDDDLLL